MTLTKTQKIYGGVLAVAAAAFAWDRASGGSSPPAGGAGAAAELLVQHSNGPTAAKPANADLLNRYAWTDRLAALAHESCLDAGAPDNAFEISPEWGVGRVAEPPPAPVTSAEAKKNTELADAFRAHHLDAVVVGARGYAAVDGQGIFIGESFDGFTLAAVGKSSATFVRDQTRVELRLATDSSIKRRGSLIENASPAVRHGTRNSKD